MTENADDGGCRLRCRWRVAAWGGAALLLLLPLIAMQVNDEVVWDVLDFAVFGALLAGIGVTIELAARKTSNAAYRFAVCVALLAAFLIVGINAAVGIIGTEHNDANLMFGGVLAVGIIGAGMARFRPGGMARALTATALAQMMVGVIALVAGLGSRGPIWPLDIVMMTAFFSALWVLSAWLFRKADREQSPPGPLMKTKHLCRNLLPQKTLRTSKTFQLS